MAWSRVSVISQRPGLLFVTRTMLTPFFTFTLGRQEGSQRVAGRPGDLFCTRLVVSRTHIRLAPLISQESWTRSTVEGAEQSSRELGLWGESGCYQNVH